MTRLRADLLLLITAIIWGTAFVAQKTGMSGIGPFGFVGVRFLFSAVVILPLVWWEKVRGAGAGITRKDALWLAALCVTFTAGVILQQIGMVTTSVTNAGFLTGLYVVMVPFVAWATFRKRPLSLIWIASLLAITGVWLLNGASLTAFGRGDLLVIGCAACFAVQVVLIGVLAQRTQRPLMLSAIQYAVCAITGLIVGCGHEQLTLIAIRADLGPLLYAGVISGGIAYTLQAVAQQYTPPSDAAIILAGESLFAALAGAMVMGDQLSLMGWCGCGMIFGAMLLVELGSLWIERRQRVQSRLDEQIEII